MADVAVQVYDSCSFSIVTIHDLKTPPASIHQPKAQGLSQGVISTW